MYPQQSGCVTRACLGRCVLDCKESCTLHVDLHGTQGTGLVSTMNTLIFFPDIISTGIKLWK